jgi:hypothetical protein
MRFLLLGLILAGCAHQQRSYSLGDDLSVVADGLEVAVRSERIRNVIGKGPLFMMRPRADYAASHCYEGFYNAYEIAHPEYPGGPPQGFLLCKNPEASDAENGGGGERRAKGRVACRGGAVCRASRVRGPWSPLASGRHPPT